MLHTICAKYFALGKMLSIQHISDTWVTGRHKLPCPRADVDNIKPFCNVTCVYQLPTYQPLHTPSLPTHTYTTMQ